MNFIEQAIFNFGFSWTFSKYIPVVLSIVIGFLIGKLILRFFLKNAKKWIRLSVLFIFMAGIFALYFAYSPIYIGDVTNGGEEYAQSSTVSEFTDKNLVVIGIPGCRYCTESFQITNAIQERYPNAEITFVLSYGDSSDLEYYQELANPKIELLLSPNEEALLPISKGNYPTFAIKEHSIIRSWSNNTIGVLALDEIENHIQ